MLTCTLLGHRWKYTGLEYFYGTSYSDKIVPLSSNPYDKDYPITVVHKMCVRCTKLTTSQIKGHWRTEEFQIGNKYAENIWQ